MKNLFIALFGAALAITFTATAQAEEKTLEGVMSCEKCNLKTAEACADALKVGDTLYALEENGKRKTSEHVCSGEAKAKVTGKVEERDGKKFIVVSKIEKSE
ncbi:MAG: hypothetical protein JNK37_21130 [Verrucomicrobiales bacterium]|nr:hypothetical protein [Verrucomicrobiales bacterium]